MNYRQFKSPQIDFTIICQDHKICPTNTNHPLAANQTIEIRVRDENDNRPQFDPSQYIFDMPEGLPIGANIGAVFAMDRDTGENARLTYSIVTSGEAQRYFVMDSIYNAQSGIIRIREVRGFLGMSVCV